MQAEDLDNKWRTIRQDIDDYWGMFPNQINANNIKKVSPMRIPLFYIIFGSTTPTLLSVSRYFFIVSNLFKNLPFPSFFSKAYDFLLKSNTVV